MDADCADCINGSPGAVGGFTRGCRRLHPVRRADSPEQGMTTSREFIASSVTVVIDTWHVVSKLMNIHSIMLPIDVGGSRGKSGEKRGKSEEE
jgi:hypothetical protein